MHVIGTAGHVDHGKSTLIEALTGTHPDRLKEEQAREMTIDLGFGWLKLPDGQEIGIVDVPGHRDFVENMLAGIGGIDAALLIVALDEGVMPQTREHLAILDLLQIPSGAIALTKLDLAQGTEQIEGVARAVRRAVEGTVMEAAPLVPVSARTGEGLGELVAAIVQVLGTRPERPDLGRPRLPIDRVFTMSGFGTVVTGTLSDGALKAGEDVEVLPTGLRGRIRGLQNHRKAVERAVPGARTAVNLSGMSAEQLRRGEVVTQPGCYESTSRLDARLRVLEDATRDLPHNCEVKVFHATAESMATLRLLDRAALSPGEQGWVQLEMRQPLVCARGDAFVLRWPSPAETVGGGVVIDPHPAGRHRRNDAVVLQSLASVATGDPADVLLDAAKALHGATIRDILQRSHLEERAADGALRTLLERRLLLALEDGTLTSQSDILVMALEDWDALRTETLDAVKSYHKRFPLRLGIPREELRSQIRRGARLFNAALAKLLAEGTLRESRNTVSSTGHEIRFNGRQKQAAERLMSKFGETPFAPPAIRDCQATAGEEVVGALIANGDLVAVSGEVVFRKKDYDEMVAGVRRILESKGEIKLAEVRDEFHTSRRFVQAFLEHLDAIGMTRRVGEGRVLAHPNPGRRPGLG
ncbi:MAG: selenocysteine-specific translation elongation factor [Anaerolineales bacterium]